MKQRFDIKSYPPGYEAMLSLSGALKKEGLERSLLELVDVRVSQMNGCAFCLAMHVPIARKAGVSEQRLYLLAAWREASVFSDRERAALAYAEAVTRMSEGGVPDAIYADLQVQFTPAEIVQLSYALVLFNGWNRLMVASNTPHQIEPGPVHASHSENDLWVRTARV